MTSIIRILRIGDAGIRRYKRKNCFIDRRYCQGAGRGIIQQNKTEMPETAASPFYYFVHSTCSPRAAKTVFAVYTALSTRGKPV